MNYMKKLLFLPGPARLLMFVSKSTARILYCLVLLVGFVQEVLWLDDPFSCAILSSEHTPRLPNAAFLRKWIVGSMHREARVVRKARDISFLAAKASKEQEKQEFGFALPYGEEVNEGGDELEKGGRISPKITEGEEDETEGPRKRQAGSEDESVEGDEEEEEPGESERDSKEKEGEEDRTSTEGEDVYMSTKLPEPSVGVADAQEACDSMHCAKVVAGASPKAKITGCARAIKCSQCRSKLDPEERCTAWKPPSRSSIILATGWAVSKVKTRLDYSIIPQQVDGGTLLLKLTPGSALNLPIKWDTQDALEDGKCLPDTKQVQYAYDKVKETGNVEKFPFTRVFSVHLAIYSTPLEGAREPKTMPQMIYYIEVTDPFPWSAVEEEQKSPQTNPRCHKSLQTLSGIQLRGRTAIFGLGWFSVLKNKSHTISPTDIRVRVECTGKRSCHLKKYAVCLRVTCPPTAASAERQMAAAFAAMKTPVGGNSSVTQPETPDSAEGEEEDPNAAVSFNYDAWVAAQQAQWGGWWASGDARTTVVSSLALACLTLISAALSHE